MLKMLLTKQTSRRRRNKLKENPSEQVAQQPDWCVCVSVCMCALGCLTTTNAKHAGASRILAFDHSFISLVGFA